MSFIWGIFWRNAHDSNNPLLVGTAHLKLQPRLLGTNMLIVLNSKLCRIWDGKLWWYSCCYLPGSKDMLTNIHSHTSPNTQTAPAHHYCDVMMGTITSQITSLTIVCSTVYSGADQRKHQSSASLAFVWGIHRGSVNSPHKWPVTRKMFPFDDVIMSPAGFVTANSIARRPDFYTDSWKTI